MKFIDKLERDLDLYPLMLPGEGHHIVQAFRMAVQCLDKAPYPLLFMVDDALRLLPAPVLIDDGQTGI